MHPYDAYDVSLGGERNAFKPHCRHWEFPRAKRKEAKIMSANRLPEAKKPKGRQETRTLVEYFHPREHAILAEYFELKKKLPKEAREIDPYEIIPKDAVWDEGKQGIVCRPGSRGEDCPSEALGNAVARIALAPIRTSLPVWGTYADGEVYHTRLQENAGKLPLRGFHSEPVLALAINWANTAPGYSWPESYYVSWIPYYDRYLVTASLDSPLNEGYLDLAIGCLPDKATVEGDLKEVIQGRWYDLFPYVQGWEECWNEGIVEDPWAWRSELWPDEEGGQ